MGEWEIKNLYSVFLSFFFSLEEVGKGEGGEAGDVGDENNERVKN